MDRPPTRSASGVPDAGCLQPRRDRAQRSAYDAGRGVGFPHSLCFPVPSLIEKGLSARPSSLRSLWPQLQIMSSLPRRAFCGNPWLARAPSTTLRSTEGSAEGRGLHQGNRSSAQRWQSVTVTPRRLHTVSVRLGHSQPQGPTRLWDGGASLGPAGI